MPRRALTDIDLKKYTKNIPHFRGIFMRDKIPSVPGKTECGIVNLDLDAGPGSHWVAYKKHENIVEYFDSFGDLQPPIELKKYFKNCKIFYNHDRVQQFNSVICGHLCLKFLIK